MKQKLLTLITLLLCLVSATRGADLTIGWTEFKALPANGGMVKITGDENTTIKSSGIAITKNSSEAPTGTFTFISTVSGYYIKSIDIKEETSNKVTSVVPSVDGTLTGPSSKKYTFVPTAKNLTEISFAITSTKNSDCYFKVVNVELTTSSTNPFERINGFTISNNIISYTNSAGGDAVSTMSSNITSGSTGRIQVKKDRYITISSETNDINFIAVRTYQDNVMDFTKATDGSDNTEIGTLSNSLYTWVTDGNYKTVKLFGPTGDNNFNVTDIFVGLAPVGPTPLSISTNPVSAEYVSGATATALTVAAAGGTTPYTYQWYSSTDAEKTSTTALTTDAEIAKGSQSASYTPSTTATGYYFCKVTDAASAEVESNVATITISTASAPTISIESSTNAAVDKGTEVTLTATVTGVPSPSIQWYSNTENNSTSGTIIDGATETTYSPSTTTGGTMYYYAKATNNYGDEDHVATSNVVSVVVNKSAACELTNIQFSNSAYGAIGTLSEGAATIEVPYLKGQTAPSVNESSIKISADASYTIVGNTLTVTAEDGTTTGTYTITKTAITPLEITEDIAKTAFTAVPSWAYAAYGWDNSKGIKMAKNQDQASNMRVATGKSRIYLFIGAAKSLTLTSGTQSRAIKVYRNGVELGTPTATAASGSDVAAIALDPSAPCMIMIENRSGSGGGDGGFTHYAITAPADEEAVSVKIAASGKSTFSSPYGLDFSNVSGLTAYKVSEITSEAVTLASVSEAAGGTGLMLVGTGGETYDIPVKSTAAAVTGNKLQASVQPTSVAAESAYILKSGEFHLVTNASTVPASKAYINKEDVPGSASNILSFIIDDSQTETDGIKNINLSFFNNGEVYNLAGQRVSTPKKGLYIVNGKKVIIK